MSDLTTLAAVKAWLGLTGKPITAITRTNPGVVTCPGHGLPSNTLLSFSGINGMTQLNGQTVTITVVDANSFSIGVDTSAYDPYVSGGFAGVDDALLQRVITGLSAAIERWLSRHFLQASYSEVRNGSGKTSIMVANTPIVSVSSVTVDGVAIPARTSVAGSGYTFDNDTIYLIGSCFSRGVQNVQLGYAAGYATIPADLDEAVVECVAFLYRERDRIGLSSKALAGETTAFLRDLPTHLTRRLEQFASVVSVE